MRRFALRTLLAVVLVALVSGLARTPLAQANSTPSTISADDAIKLLTEGNARFVSGKPKHPHADAARRTETAKKGQHPFAIVLSCADSRVPVELIFDQGIGDVFVIRVAGNVCSSNEAASIEYAAEHIGSPLIVVLGHSKCGAVTAVATGAKLEGHLLDLAKLIKPAVDTAQKAHPAVHGEALVPDAIKENVWQGIQTSLKDSPIINERVKAGKVKVVGAIYDITDGKVEWLGPHPNQEKLLAEVAGAEHPKVAAEPTNHSVPPSQHSSEGPAAKPAADEHKTATTPHAETVTEHKPAAPQVAEHKLAEPQAPEHRSAEPVVAEHKPVEPKVAEHRPVAQIATVALAPQPSDATGSTGLLERCLAEELCRVGSANLERGQYAAAAERFRAALDIDPSLLAAMNNLAGIYYLQRDYSKAIELYNAVLARDGGHRSALRGVALVYATQKQYPQSREMLKRLLTSNERDAQVWLDLGDVLYLMSDAAGARQHWTKAAEIDRTADQVIAKAHRRLQAYPPGKVGLTAATPAER